MRVKDRIIISDVSCVSVNERRAQTFRKIANCDRRQMDEPGYEPGTPEAINNSPVYAFYTYLGKLNTAFILQQTYNFCKHQATNG